MSAPTTPSAGGAGTPPRRGRPSTLDRESALVAAWSVIAKRGLERTRFADVAAASGAPVSTLQNAFGSLRAMLGEAVVLAADRSEAVLAALPGPDAPPVDRMQALVLGALRGGTQVDSATLRLELWCGATRDAAIAARCAEAHDRWLDAARGIVEQGQREGSFTTEADAPVLAAAVIAILDGVLTASVVAPQDGVPATQAALTGVERLLAP